MKIYGTSLDDLNPEYPVNPVKEVSLYDLNYYRRLKWK